MFETIGHSVSKLKRVAIGPIRDAALAVGATRRLSHEEVSALRRSLAQPESATSVLAGRTRRARSPQGLAFTIAIALDGGRGRSAVRTSLAGRREGTAAGNSTTTGGTRGPGTPARPGPSGCAPALRLSPHSRSRFATAFARRPAPAAKTVSLPNQPIVVAIDGPSGAGKSTAARALAARLGIPYIDTGAMYRAVGLAARQRGLALPLAGAPAMERAAEIAQSLRIELLPDPRGTRVLCDDRDVTDAIREPEISLYASAVSAIPAVRRRLVSEQQRLGRARGGVLEGRDIGTKVFPETPFKFFLTAPAAIRAARRTRELAERGTPQPYETVLAEMEKRDSDDASRADSPLTLDGRYVLIDTESLSPGGVVDAMEARVAGSGG